MYRIHLRLPGRGVGGHKVAFRIPATLAAVIALAVLATAATGLVMRGAVPHLGNAQPERAPEWTPTYSTDVKPIFDRSCVQCHGPRRADKGLRLDSFQRTMAGDSYGTVVIPGDSSLSAMVSVLKYGTMPHGASKLTADEIETISRWIDAGAKNE